MKEIFYMRGDMLGNYCGSYFGRSGWSIMGKMYMLWQENTGIQRAG